MSKPLLKLENVNVGYGTKEIVHDVSMELEKGKFVALVGLNGCGKTTLLKGLLGNATCTGNIHIQDKNLQNISIKQRAKEVAYVSQQNDITFSIDVWDVLMMGFNPYTTFWEKPTAEMKEKAMDVMKLFGIENYIHEDYMALSGGQKQLVIFARVLLQDSKLWLLDEPDSAMDFTNRHHVLQLVRQTLKSTNKSALITIHDPNFAFQYCDEVYFMREGKLVDRVVMNEVKADKLKGILQQMYGDVDVLDYNGRHLMVKS